MVGAADDQYEHEADRVAREVVNTPDEVAANSMQRVTFPEEDEEKRIQVKLFTETNIRSLRRQPETDEEETAPIQATSAGSPADSFEAGDDVESQVSRSQGRGSPLPDPVRAYMEPRFGADFSDVRIHTGRAALQMNRAIGAQAFTRGSDIYLGARSNPADLELMAHELTHVVQQTRHDANQRTSQSSNTPIARNAGERRLLTRNAERECLTPFAQHRMIRAVGYPSGPVLQRGGGDDSGGGKAGKPVPHPEPLTTGRIEDPGGRRIRISEYGRTDPNERLEPGQKPSLSELYWVEFEVDATGTMKASARTVDDAGKYRSPNLVLSTEFNKALEHFRTKGGIEVQQFRGDWSWMSPTEMSTNLKVYNEARKAGAKPAEAARQTPSGKIAVAAGYTEVRVLSDQPEKVEDIGDGKDYQRVRVSFSRPGRGRPPTGTGTVPPPTGSTTKTGTKVAAYGALAVLGASVTLNWLIEGQNEKRIRDELARKEPTIRQEQQENPTLGFLLLFRYKGGATGAEGSSASPSFDGLTWRRGYTRAETEATWKGEASYTAGQYKYEPGWIDPIEKPSPMVVATPFEKVALAKFADITRIEFQRVLFKEWGGFETKGTHGPINAAKWAEEARALRFLVLRMPAEITIRNVAGRLTTTEVESTDVPVIGGSAPALVLDGTVAVTVWAADATTEDLFEHTNRVSDLEGKLNPIPNIDRVRWLRPEQVHLVSPL